MRKFLLFLLVPLLLLLVSLHDSIIITYPVANGGDNYPQLQALLNRGQAIHLSGGAFPISKPLIVSHKVGTDYVQSWCYIEGASSAMNSSTSQVSLIVPLFKNTFAIGLQECKGCTIKNLAIQGEYTFPNNLNTVQLDTLSYDEWDDGTCSTNVNSPYAGIAIDPFSDPANYDSTHLMYAGLTGYYLPGMRQSGSTDIEMSGLAITNFIAGIIVSPGYQENGELIDLNNSSIQDCRSAYVYTQAQSKANTVYRLKVWGQVQTVFDTRYGAHRSDGATMPMINVVNIAGAVNELIAGYTNTFPGVISRVYGEGLWRIGVSGGGAGMHFADCQFDLQANYAGVPSPPYWYFGENTHFTDCMFRIYGPVPGERIVMNWPNCDFDHCVFSAPPVVRIAAFPFQDYVGSLFPASLFKCNMYYGSDQNSQVTGTGYDSVIAYGTGTITVNPDYTGYIVIPGFTTLPNSNDLLITTHFYPEAENQFSSDEFPAGYVKYPSNDTIYLFNIGSAFHTGDMVAVSNAKIKVQQPN